MVAMISEEYKNQLLELRARRPWGTSGFGKADMVNAFIEKIGAKSILDYGAGTQSLGPKVNIKYCAYDPAVPGIDKRPVPTCDLVVAIDVMEHVEPVYTMAVLEDISKHATKGVLLYIPLTKAVAVLPDGRNAHINLRPPTEWLALLKRYPATKTTAEYNDRALTVWIEKNG